MVKMTVTYEGSLRTRLWHEPSGTEWITDAPKDNQGEGKSFSPTDMTASSLAACILTTMGIVAKKHAVTLDGAQATVIKEMTEAAPRKIACIRIAIGMPAGIPHEKRALLEHIAEACPVHRSLHPDVQKPVTFTYPD